MTCADCGLLAGDYGCPVCGEWLCAECLMRHDARHYDESDMAAEDDRECWPEGEPADDVNQSLPGM